MASFIEDLWESIFTPGPTASLMLATHVTFATLQTVLFVLLLATYSIHFVILSFLCAGLWWAITWFARELQASQRREEQAARDAEERARKQQRRVAAVAAATASASSDSETEVEGSAPVPRPQQQQQQQQQQQPTTTGKTTAVEKRAAAAAAGTRQRPTAEAAAAAEAAAEAAAAAGTRQETPGRTLGPSSTAPEPTTPPSQTFAANKVNQSLSLSGSRSGVSTEDEWEKVSEGENDKDK